MKDKWYYLLIRYDSGNLSLYLNDDMVNSSIWSDSITFDSKIVLGQKLIGVIDEFKINNRSFSDDEID